MKRLLFIALLAAGCAKSSSEQPKAEAAAPQSERENGQAQPSRGKSAANANAHKDDKNKGDNSDDKNKDGKKESGEGPPVSSSWQGLLADGGVEQIQDALAAKGFLDAKHQKGALDGATREAMREFQKSKQIPATGIPDQKTVAALGLDNDKIFRPGNEPGR